MAGAARRIIIAALARGTSALRISASARRFPDMAAAARIERSGDIGPARRLFTAARPGRPGCLGKHRHVAESHSSIERPRFSTVKLPMACPIHADGFMMPDLPCGITMTGMTAARRAATSAARISCFAEGRHSAAKPPH